MEFSVNWVAVIAAAVAGAIINALWYSVILKPQVGALRRADATIGGRDPVPPLYAIALTAQLVMAFVLAVFFRSVGGAGIGQGVFVGAMGWLGFTIPAMAVTHSFGYRRPMFIVIDGSSWLLAALAMGAIIGALG